MRIYLFVFILFTFCSCKENTVKTEISEVDILVQKGIEASGGWENWQMLDTITFYKMSKLYFDDGTLEDSTYQLHTYNRHPEMSGKYSWESEGNEYEVVYKNGDITKLKNNILLDLTKEEKEKLRLSFLGSQFVMCLPFKLRDPGVKLELSGESQINNRMVNVIKASYNTENENHADSHDWWYYFDIETNAMLGYKVHHPPTFAKVSNVTTTDVKGVVFPTYRKSFRTDKDDNEKYVRAEFWYSYEK